MNSRLLITFGCSWTFGVGSGYHPSMTFREYEQIAWDLNTCNNFSWRTILAKKYKLDNLNFSSGGSSNARQFRIAKNFFGSTKFKELQKQYTEIIVLWGITSTARGEFYSCNKQQLLDIFYNEENQLSKFIVKNCYDHTHECFMLAQEMSFWNTFFNNINIKNFWFDTFNHHDYTVNSPGILYWKDDYESNSGKDWPSWDQFLNKDFRDTLEEVRNEILDASRFNFAQLLNQTNITNFIVDKKPRDLMSLMCEKFNFFVDEPSYHHSDWSIDSNRVEFLIQEKCLNPYTKHPTQRGIDIIVDIIDSNIGKQLRG